MENTKFDDLIKAAMSARENAFAPYSQFKVGAALRTADGEMITGCNVESAVYGATACAERIAIWKAVSEGKLKFSAIAVVADTQDLTPPCGICRQVIWELCGDIPVVFANLDGKSEILQMKDLLPRAFDSSFLS
ncbi:MAG: cytidine deaminase [Pyrinomonadaceae bacterium]|nr:cytidine deaminase [Pyrinomonadaceae bacterium]